MRKLGGCYRIRVQIYVDELGHFSKRDHPLPRPFKISVDFENAFEVDADVLVLKYAQNLHGADKAAYDRLTKAGVKLRLPKPNSFAFQGSAGSMTPKNILFVGVAPLHDFSYSEIRDFARGAMTFLAQEAPDVQSVALTIHGPNYGLDEVEAFESELAGIVEAAVAGHLPRNLKFVSFVEFDEGRASRLTLVLKRLFPDGAIVVHEGGAATGIEGRTQRTLRSAGNASSRKSHVFVAMPFAKEMDDVFHYGIQGAVNAAGLLCERADLSSFTGDVIDWVKQRISDATLVIADLSSANPNVYLEIGYAWGRQIPTVLIVRNTDELKFDTRGQRCIPYDSIKNLEDLLGKELQGLRRSGKIS